MDLMDKLNHFDPNGVGNTSSGIFGLPFEPGESKLVLIPMPWDVTVSNHAGTSKAPALIATNSSQIDLFDPFAIDAWKQGIAMEPIDQTMVALNATLRKSAVKVIRFLEQGGLADADKTIAKAIKSINKACLEVSRTLEKTCLLSYKEGRIPLVVGGDHSVSLGAVRAATKEYPGLGVLQIDAHADLRNHYQGFTHSHASIMKNILGLENLGPVVQVGIREICDEEYKVIGEYAGKVFTWYDRDLFQHLAKGKTWDALCHEMIRALPDKVYITFDIDGLDPSMCPNTGTPVPGGLSYNQLMHLFETIVESGRQIVGADLVETGGDTFDATIACRILYRMAGMMIKSQNHPS